MKVKLNKPARVNALPGEIEVSEAEYRRLQLLCLCEPLIEKKAKETPEKAVAKETRKK